MPFQIEEMLVLDIGRIRYPDGTRIETSAAIGRVLVVEAFPAELNWRLAIRYRSDARSTVTCDARLTDPRSRPLPAGHLKFVAEPGSHCEEMPVPVFTATAKGTYTVHLHVNGSSTPSISEAIVVDVAASLA